MSNPTLVAQTRSEFGKGAARRARRAGLVPGVLYGHGDAPLHVDLPGHELFLAVRGQKNALVELVIEGKKHLALVKEVQRHPVSRNLLHADFLAVKAGELVDVEVPVSIIGEPAPGTQHCWSRLPPPPSPSPSRSTSPVSRPELRFALPT